MIEAQTALSVVDLRTVDYFRFILPPRISNGSASVIQTLALPPDALVERFEVTIVVGKSDWTPLGNVGAVRRTRQTVVVDFGAPRTVSGVAVLAVSPGFAIVQVTAWMGASFAVNDVLGAAVSSAADSGSFLLSFSEVQTQKLQIRVSSTAPTTGDLSTEIGVQLPDLPADFDLRIDDGPPVWTHRGTVPTAPTSGEGPVSGWSFPADGFPFTTFDLGPALSALRGDPKGAHDPPSPGFQVTLSARVPGALALDLPPLTGDPSAVIRHLYRVVSDGFEDGMLALTFATEGSQRLSITVPTLPATVSGGNATTVVGLRAVVAAKLGPERALPPVGPEAALGPPRRGESAPSPLAELVIDPAHAVAIRLRAGSAEDHGGDFSQLVALELPLVASSGGAELAVELRAPAEDGGPGEALAGGRARPVALAAGAGADAWTNLTFAKPFVLKDGAPLPWVVLATSRGAVTWSLAQPRATSDSSGGPEIRRGPPTGPWLPLPAVLLDLPSEGATAALTDFAPRLRQVGLARSDRPISPVVVAVHAPGTDAVVAEQAITPVPKGNLTRIVDFSSPIAPGSDGKVSVEVISLLAGSVTLSDVDLILAADAN